MTAPKTGQRGALEARERPHAEAYTDSLVRRADRGRQPQTLGQYLRWYSEGWDAEVPTSIHKTEVWRDHGVHAEGGSKLGTPAWGDRFRRYMENTPSEVDEDGWFVRPMHAALSRIERRWPLTARALFAVAQSGYDWKGVGTRLGYADEMFHGYLLWAFGQLWGEYRDEVVRLG